MASPVALDHNFSEPVLASVSRWLKDVEFHHLRHIDPRLAELQDHELIYDLDDRDLPILVTHNWKMENDPRVVVAVHLTKFTLLTLRRAGDDMIFATGVLLRDIVPVLRKEVPKGQIFKAKRSQIRPRPAYMVLQDLARHANTTADALIELHLQFARRVDESIGQSGKCLTSRQLVLSALWGVSLGRDTSRDEEKIRGFQDAKVVQDRAGCARERLQVRCRGIGRYARRALLGALVWSSHDKRRHSRHRHGLDVQQPQPRSVWQSTGCVESASDRPIASGSTEA